MKDDPAIYINASTPGFAHALVVPNGPTVDCIFDAPFEDETSRPQMTCVESDAKDFRSRETELVINSKTYRVVARPFLDGMGLATVFLQEQ